MYKYLYHDQYLMHYGVKGMKWGVRRYQKKDGTLTSAGKKRYSDKGSNNTPQKYSPTTSSKNLKKISHKDVLEKKYRDSGMSESEAKAAAERRIKVEKAIAITAGVTVAACAAYYAKNKWTQTHCDQILKAGTTFHNLDSAANERPGEHLYVNYRQNDKNYFRGHFAVNKMRKTGHVFDHTLTANEDIKIPSINTRKNVFKQLYENDREFRDAFEKHTFGTTGEGVIKMPNLTYKMMWQKFGDKDNPEFNVAKRKYFEALRQKGYEAIVDEWDTNPSVFRSDAPLILLNTSSKSFGEMTIKELTEKDILLAQADSRHYESIRSLKTTIGLPHTNHFKESKKSLARSAAKTAKNKEYIDKFLDEAKKTGLLDSEDIRKATLREHGKNYADAGKYMTKKGFSAKKALARRATVSTMKDTAKSIGILTLPYAVLAKTNRSNYARNYLKEHPDTKLTYKQIKDMYGYNSKIREYIEDHPNTKMTYAQILKLYYGLDGKKLRTG